MNSVDLKNVTMDTMRNADVVIVNNTIVKNRFPSIIDIFDCDKSKIQIIKN